MSPPFMLVVTVFQFFVNPERLERFESRLRLIKVFLSVKLSIFFQWLVDLYRTWTHRILIKPNSSLGLLIQTTYQGKWIWSKATKQNCDSSATAGTLFDNTWANDKLITSWLLSSLALTDSSLTEFESNRVCFNSADFWILLMSGNVLHSALALNDKTHGHWVRLCVCMWKSFREAYFEGLRHRIML